MSIDPYIASTIYFFPFLLLFATLVFYQLQVGGFFVSVRQAIMFLFLPSRCKRFFGCDDFISQFTLIASSFHRHTHTQKNREEKRDVQTFEKGRNREAHLTPDPSSLSFICTLFNSKHFPSTLEVELFHVICFEPFTLILIDLEFPSSSRRFPLSFSFFSFTLLLLLQPGSKNRENHINLRLNAQRCPSSPTRSKMRRERPRLAAVSPTESHSLSSY